jgi:hypothetical protein
MAERFSDRVTECGTCGKTNAYNRVANMSAKGEDRERTEWWQVVAFCKTCRPKFEKREDFIDWMEPSKK